MEVLNMPKITVDDENGLNEFELSQEEIDKMFDAIGLVKVCDDCGAEKSVCVCS
jgi:hypothetical protein